MFSVLLILLSEFPLFSIKIAEQSKHLPKREGKDEKECSSEALAKSLKLYQEKGCASLAKASLEAVTAGIKQASVIVAQLRPGAQHSHGLLV